MTIIPIASCDEYNDDDNCSRVYNDDEEPTIFNLSESLFGGLFRTLLFLSSQTPLRFTFTPEGCDWILAVLEFFQKY